MKSAAVLIGFFVLVLGVVFNSAYEPVVAQQAKPAFEVASIKPNTIGELAAWSITYRGDGFRATNATLSSLIQFAYGIREYRLLGGPDWLRTARFDVDARAGMEVPREQQRLMAQQLLEDRFGVRLTREDREEEIYTLRLARSDGRIGPDLRRAADDCAGVVSDPLTRTLPKSSTGFLPAMFGSCTTMTALATALSRPIGSNVVDRTGLEGKWDYVLAYAALERGSVVVGGQENLPTVIVAVEEQLGLKLDRDGRGMVEYFIVTAHPPTEN